MATFPATLYLHGSSGAQQSPVVGTFDNVMATDPAIRSQSEGGYVTSRARFTRVARKWTVRYEWMTKANKNTIKTFEDARRAGADSFTWTNPEDSASYTVRFMEPVRYTAHPHVNWLWWTVEFVLEQV